jgi:hypothetical protein
MEKLLATYLFQYNVCALPTIGALVLTPGNAQPIAGEKRILGPMPHIELSRKELSPFDLTDFIARHQNISTATARNLLDQYCEAIKQLPPFGELRMHTAGSFYVDEHAVLHFKSASMPAVFSPEVLVERVIHLDTPHQMLVGDTQTNTVAMSELLNEEAPIKSRWWIAALLMALIALALLFYYYSRHHLGEFGNESGFSSAVPANHQTSSTTQ